MNTEIILMKDIDGLGEEGDIKKVAPGYARNYLLPFKFAVVKNQAALKRLESQRESINQRKAQKLDVSKGIHEKVIGTEVSFEVNAGENGKLFGSITQSDILNSLTEKGIEIDKNQILLPKPIKSIGDYDVSVRFYGGLTAQIKVKVVDQNTDDTKEKPEIKDEKQPEQGEEKPVVQDKKQPEPENEKQEQATESVQ